MQTPSNKTKRNGSLASPTASTAPLAKSRLHREKDSTAESVGFLTASKLRARWEVSGMFLWRLRSKGKLTAYKIGSRGVRFSLAEIEQIERNAATVTGGGLAQ